MKYIQPNWPAPSGIKAYTTLRDGWGGRHLYHEEGTINEGNQLKALLKLPDEPIWLKQTHSTINIEAKPENRDKNADASFSTHTNRVCVVLTADCLPILICNKQGSHVAAIHAGWRGLAHGIIENSIETLDQNPDDLLVWLGPAIGPHKFEVGKDVYDAFTAKHAESANAFTPCSHEKWLADLYALAKIRLKLHGITHTYGGDFCTYTQENLFYSYRRDKGNTGRMASVIWISP